MLAVALAVASSVAWGLADFVGGLKSRRFAVAAVLVVSQGAGLVLIAAIVAARGESPPPGDFALYAAISAIAGIAGLAALYRGLAVGVMSVVAPLSATAAAIPVTVGIATGDRPSALQVAGIGLAICGAVFAAREPRSDSGDAHAGITAGAGLGLLAAVGFGSFFLAMDKASDGDVFWAIFVNRVTGVGLLVLAVLALRASIPPEPRELAALASIGLLDITANTLYGFASTEGLVSVVAVVSSLYPLVTIALARVVLHERIARAQQLGVAVALGGVVLITAG